jgi:hypothetical protein
MSKEVLVEAVKEFLRVVVLSIIPILVTNLGNGHFDWKLIWVTGAIAGLRFIDKLLHEIGMEKESTGTKAKPVTSSLTLGLTRF